MGKSIDVTWGPLKSVASGGSLLAVDFSFLVEL